MINDSQANPHSVVSLSLVDPLLQLGIISATDNIIQTSVPSCKCIIFISRSFGEIKSLSASSDPASSRRIRNLPKKTWLLLVNLTIEFSNIHFFYVQVLTSKDILN